MDERDRDEAATVCEDFGGTGQGPTPYDLLAGALGGCTAMTLQFYAKRDGLPLERSDQATLDEMMTLIEARHGFEPFVITGHDDVLGVVTIHDGLVKVVEADGVLERQHSPGRL